jgi:hypothetical protein
VKGVEKMKVKVRLDTVTDIANFVLIASQVKSNVYLTNNNGLKVDGKSFLGVAHACEFENLWCECDEDLYTQIHSFIV